MRALICGSYAYDNIMVFHDRFKNHILPDKVHMLNISFLVPEMRKEYGGCAGNIAYNLKLLGGDPMPMATVGTDFQPYRQWLKKCGIDDTYVREMGGTYTAQAFITTDLDDNQITAFHPGAMGLSHENQLPADDNISIGTISPDGRDGMIMHAEQFAERGIKFIFDPGQGMPMFDGDDLLRFVEQAAWITVNDYEAELLQERTGKSPHEIAAMVEAYIVTRGGEGSYIYTRDKRYEVAAVAPKAIADPTGCGDAYRAGLLFGIMNEMDWETTARIASCMGTIKIEHYGTQNHQFTLDQFKARFRKAYNYDY